MMALAVTCNGEIMGNSIMFTYYTLESKNTYEYHYYYFTGFDASGNQQTTDAPGKALAFHTRKEAKKFLEFYPMLKNVYNIQTIFSNEMPNYVKV